MTLFVVEAFEVTHEKLPEYQLDWDHNVDFNLFDTRPIVENHTYDHKRFRNIFMFLYLLKQRINHLPTEERESGHKEERLPR